MTNSYLLKDVLEELELKYDPEGLGGMVYGPEEILKDLKLIKTTAKFIDFYNDCDPDLKKVMDDLITCKNGTLICSDSQTRKITSEWIENHILTTLGTLLTLHDVEDEDLAMLLEFFEV